MKDTPGLLVEFGKELRKLLNSKEVFALLSEGDWGAGGCWTLANALMAYFGPPAELVAVSESRPGVPVSHVVVKYVDLYVDYNGAQTKTQLMRNLGKEGYKDPELKPMTRKLEKEAARHGIPCDLWASRELLKHLNENFGY